MDAIKAKPVASDSALDSCFNTHEEAQRSGPMALEASPAGAFAQGRSYEDLADDVPRSYLSSCCL